MTDKPHPEEMPATIGRYQIHESVGFGAMGAVYKAFDPLIKRTLAIKTIRLDIPKQSAQYQTFIERFYHEARISGTLSHPNIVTLFDIGEEQGIPYLAMEYVPGQTVSSLLEGGTRFSPERVVNIVGQVASAVDYAHLRGVIHRDIKPSNVILHEGDKVKVTDFGIAKLANADMTQSGTLLGTPSYMSPEQAMGEKVDGRSDIFSLGVCAFEMLSARQPFPGSNVTAILYKLVHDEPIVPPDLEQSGLIPDKWRAVFSKALAKKPADRYATASSFVSELESCMGSVIGAGEPTLTGLASTRPPVPPEPTVVVPRMPGQPDAEPIEISPTVAVSAGSKTAGARGADAEAPTIATSAGQPTMAPAPSPVTRAVSTPHGSQTVAPQADLPTVVTPAMVAPPQPPAPPPPAAARTLVQPPSPRRAAEPTPAARAGAAVVASGARATPRRTVLPLLLLGVVALAVLAGVGFLLLRRPPIAPEDTPTPMAQVTPTPSPAATPALPLSGSLRVLSEPTGAAVLVNGEPKGNTPLDVADLAFGDYTVKLDLRGYESQTQPVALSAEAAAAEVNAKLVRRVRSIASIDISSQPEGADVSLDGGIIGRTPILEMKLRPGTYRVDLTREGHEPYSTTVRVEPGKKAKVAAVLRAASAATPQATPTATLAVEAGRVYTDKEVTEKPTKVAGQTASYPSGVSRLKSGQTVSVMLSLVVSETGEVSDIQVVESGGAKLDEAVLKAARGFRYKPGQLNGKPVKVRTTFKQSFRGA